MSRQETESLVRRFIDTFNAGDHDTMAACLTDDIAHDLNRDGREIGAEKLRWRLGMAARHFDATIADVAIMTDEGGVRAAAEFTLRGTYRATAEGLPAAEGQRFSLPAGLFLEVDDGRISRLTACYNRDALIGQLAGR